MDREVVDPARAALFRNEVVDGRVGFEVRAHRIHDVSGPRMVDEHRAAHEPRALLRGVEPPHRPRDSVQPVRRVLEFRLGDLVVRPLVKLVVRRIELVNLSRWREDHRWRCGISPFRVGAWKADLLGTKPLLVCESDFFQGRGEDFAHVVKHHPFLR